MYLFEFFTLVKALVEEEKVDDPTHFDRMPKTPRKKKSISDGSIFDAVRDEIKSQMIDLLESKGGANFKSLNSDDLEHLFRLYDNLFFGNQIVEKISDRGATVEFRTDRRKSGAGGRCGLNREGVPKNRSCVYFLEIAPNVLNSILTEAKGWPDDDHLRKTLKTRLDAFCLIMEHQIIHLLMIVWGYSEEDASGVDFEDFESFIEPHGPIFKCLLQRFFGRGGDIDGEIFHTAVEEGDDSIPLSEVDDVARRGDGKKKKGLAAKQGFVNWSNSCYMDSAVVILMASKSSYFRDTIVGTDLEKVTFNRGDCSAIAEKNRKLRDAEKPELTDVQIQTLIRRQATEFQDAFEEDLYRLSATRENDPSIGLKCTNMRNILAGCIEGLKTPSGRWPMMEARKAYEGVVGLSPGLKIRYPRQINRWNATRKIYERDTVQYAEIAMFPVWDFMDPLTDIDRGSDYSRIRWDLFDAPILVFSNEGVPRIKKFDSLRPESGVNFLGGSPHKFSIEKARVLDFFLDLGEKVGRARYELVGVTILHGVSEGAEDGSHYTSYIKRRVSGRKNSTVPEKRLGWYHYDDLRGTFEEVPNIKRSQLFHEKNGRMPTMFFYSRIA